MKLAVYEKIFKQATIMFKEETGIEPHCYAIKEHEDDMSLLTFHFCSDTEYYRGSTTAYSPHLYAHFDPTGEEGMVWEWDGLERWKAKKKGKKP